MCGNRRDQRILRRRDARLVEEDVGALELRRAELQPIGRRNGRAKLFEGQKMRVEPPASDHIAARRWQRHLAAAGEQRAGQKDGGANPGAEHGIKVGCANVLGVDREPVATAPFGRGTD